MATTAEGATSAGDPGVRGLYHGAGRESPKGNPPPPAAAKCLAPWLCCAYYVPAKCVQRRGGEKGAPPPPPTPPPPRGRMRVGRGRKAPPPPHEGNAAGWGGRGRRVRDEPHDRARRGRAPCKPRRGDHRGCRRRIEGATKGAARQTPPPPSGGTGATPRACDARATEGKRQGPPPPHASAPPRVGVAGREGRAAAPPLQRRGHRGSARSVGRAKTRATRRAPHPSRRTSAVPRASAVPATCLRRRKGNQGAPPPRPHLPHPPRTEARATGRRRGGKRDDGSGRRTPPGDTAAGWGGKGTRRPCPRGARAVQAPRGGPPGVQPQEG